MPRPSPAQPAGEQLVEAISDRVIVFSSYLSQSEMRPPKIRHDYKQANSQDSGVLFIIGVAMNAALCYEGSQLNKMIVMLCHLE